LAAVAHRAYGLSRLVTVSDDLLDLQGNAVAGGNAWRQGR
jgi:hypothetical protein